MSGPARIVETERLILQPHRATDFEDCAQLWGDAEVTRFIGGRALSAEETWARILRYAGLWSLLGYGYWAVREKVSDRFVGDVGLADFKRAIEPSLVGVPEMGWVLASWAHGKGFATEAVAAALRWSDTHLEARQTVCIIVPEHQRSIRVAEKAGYHASAHGRYNEKPMTIYVRPGATR